jgi:hypothetical protein
MARNWSIGKDNHAQISIDYMVGIGVFIAAFIFVYAFVPTIFTPFYTNSDELTMVTDRAAATLVDNMLAIDDDTTKLPGILDAKKISDLKDSMTSDDVSVRNSLGLNSNGNANLIYNIEIIIEIEDEPQPININHNSFPQNNNVGQSKRFVLIRDMQSEDFRDVYPGRKAILTVRVW